MGLSTHIHSLPIMPQIHLPHTPSSDPHGLSPASAPHPEGGLKALGHLTAHLETLTWLPSHSVEKPEASQQPQDPASPATSSCLGSATPASLLQFKHTRLTSAPGTLRVLFLLPQGLCTCSLHISEWLIASAPPGFRQLSPPPDLKRLLPSTPSSLLPPPPRSSLRSIRHRLTVNILYLFLVWNKTSLWQGFMSVCLSWSLLRPRTRTCSRRAQTLFAGRRGCVRTVPKEAHPGCCAGCAGGLWRACKGR